MILRGNRYNNIYWNYPKYFINNYMYNKKFLTKLPPIDSALIDYYPTDKLLRIMFDYYYDDNNISVLTFKKLIDRYDILIYLSENNVIINSDKFELKNNIHKININVYINGYKLSLGEIFIKKYIIKNDILRKSNIFNNEFWSYNDSFNNDGLVFVKNNKLIINYELILFYIINNVNYSDVFINHDDDCNESVSMKYFWVFVQYSLYGFGLYYGCRYFKKYILN